VGDGDEVIVQQRSVSRKGSPLVTQVGDFRFFFVGAAILSFST